MTATANQGFASLAERIDAAEEAYEFCLAYAAQGRRGDESGAGSEIRRFSNALWRRSTAWRMRPA